MSFLVIDSVSRTFPGSRTASAVTALETTDLEVKRNDFVTILGPSGCGKSTLLRLVAGLDLPTTGKVTLEGRPIRRPGPDRGMVFQSYTLFPWLSVRENIGFGLQERGLPTAEIRQTVTAYIDDVGLSGFDDHLPAQLSGGMQQRCAIARALANRPKVLLLDEPFGALDNQTRGLMQELLLSIWEKERKTVMFVTHDIEEAVFMGERVVTMTARPGRIKSITPVDFRHPRSYTLKSTQAFSALRATLTEEIRGEAIRAASS